MGIDYTFSETQQRRECGEKSPTLDRPNCKYSLACSICVLAVAMEYGALCHGFIHIRCTDLDFTNTPPIPPIVFSLHPSGLRAIRHSPIHNVVRGDSRVHHIVSTMNIRGYIHRMNASHRRLSGDVSILLWGGKGVRTLVWHEHDIRLIEIPYLNHHSDTIPLVVRVLMELFEAMITLLRFFPDQTTEWKSLTDGAIE
jgi:hypothetical protein